MISSDHTAIIPKQQSTSKGQLSGNGVLPMVNYAARDPQSVGRKRVVVVAWDLGHNPVGRAYLLADILSKKYDVTLIGPLFSRYGGKIWAPLRTSEFKIRTFVSEKMHDFLDSALNIIREIDADLVYTCKARLPSILLGLLLKYQCGCPVIIDVDDHELSFFPNRAPLKLREFIEGRESIDDLDLPFGESWTRVCETLIPYFDGITVSNVVLQKRFGGSIVRHARDETKFMPDDSVRSRVRAQFGYGENDRVILFLGTPRAHKGIFRIAEAMRRLGDERLVLCVIGSPNDRRVEQQLLDFSGARIELHGDRPWEELPTLVHLADGACLFQQEASPIAEYQIPAKLTDMLSIGVPVAATDVPPLADVPSPDIIVKVRNDQQIDAFLLSVANRTVGGEKFKVASRKYFLDELSYKTASERLDDLFDKAERKAKNWSEEISCLFSFLSDEFQVDLPIENPYWLRDIKGAPAIKRDRAIDIAFFWKQNDSGIYGRRHDMLLKHLARHPRIGRIVQFDAPIPIHQLNKIKNEDESLQDQSNWVVGNVLTRFLRSADSGSIARRVFVYRDGDRPQSLLGVNLPAKEEYADWVRRQLSEVAPVRSFLSWVTPVVFDYPQLHDEFKFHLSVADIIDDQRAMPTTPENKAKLSQSYVDTLSRVDIVFANCEAAAEAFSEIRPDANIVTNAGEILASSGLHVAAPWELRRLKRPIIGYVGNLRDRVDVELLKRMAVEHPEWSIVLIGSAHRDPPVLRLRNLPNVYFLGVKPYEEALHYMRSFDVAIMPHLRNEVSNLMNPLKLYVYCSVGVPIVTTAVANIDDMVKIANVANSHGEFIAMVESIVNNPEDLSDKICNLPAEHSWENRTEQILGVIDGFINM